MRRAPTTAATGGLFATAVLVGCTGAPHSAGIEGTREPAPSSAGLSAIGVPGGTLRLTCEDAGDGSLDESAADNLVLGGAIFELFRAELDSVPTAVSVGLTIPPALATWQFRKVPVYLAAGEQPITVTIAADGEAMLAWVPSRVWTSGDPPDLGDWLATTVTFDGCPERPTTYFGGVAADTAHTCLHLQAQTASGAESQHQRLDGTACANPR